MKVTTCLAAILNFVPILDFNLVINLNLYLNNVTVRCLSKVFQTGVPSMGFLDELDQSYSPVHICQTNRANLFQRMLT